MEATARGRLDAVGHDGLLALEIVAVVRLSRLRVEPGAQERLFAEPQRPILPQTHHGKIPVIEEIEEKALIKLAKGAATPIKVREREHGLTGKFFPEPTLPARPRVVATVIAVQIGIAGLFEFQGVAGMQKVK